MKLPPVEYASPRSIDEVIRLLSDRQDAKVLSGGQSLMPMLAFRLASCGLLVDLKDVPGLDRITVDQNGLEIGARVTWRHLERDRSLRHAHPLLQAAIPHIAHYQIRNRGTVGGSLAHADPAAELPALAVTCEAEIIAAGPAGRRAIPAREFFLSPLVTALAPDEVIVALKLPAFPARRRHGFEEFAMRRGDFALAGAIVFYDHDARGRIRDPHVGAFGVADTPLRLSRAEDVLAGAMPDDRTFAQAAAAGTAGLDARSDIHADGDYRRALLATLLTRALRSAAARVGA
ncbi:MAG TPA: FAD binding domain-containing protein [Xanthobacteraceae bacterium]|nr:FAD binding domain-containing protein [Xanthobacteraceae bacterium]